MNVFEAYFFWYGFGGSILSTHSHCVILLIARDGCTEIEKLYQGVAYKVSKYYILDFKNNLKELQHYVEETISIKG